MDYFTSYKKIKVFFFIFIIITTMIVSLLWWSSTKKWLGAISRSVTIFAVVPIAQKNVGFSPSQGGSTMVTSGDGDTVAFSFPRNFSNTSANVQLRATMHSNTFFENDKPAPSGKTFVGKTYNFDLYNMSSGVQMVRVAKPIIIRIQYTKAETAEIDESTLAPYRREDEDSEWQLISDGVVDITTHSITFSTDQFSSFTLLGSSTQTASSGGGGLYYLTSVLKNVLQPKPLENNPIAINSVPIQAPSVTSGTSFLSKSLKIGSVDQEVVLLQKYLNTHGFLVTAKGVGSPGFETTKFGILTYKALVKFQEAHAADILSPNLKKGTGTVGPKTRGYINNHP